MFVKLNKYLSELIDIQYIANVGHTRTHAFTHHVSNLNTTPFVKSVMHLEINNFVKK